MQIGIVEETQPKDFDAGLSVRVNGGNRERRRLLEDDAPDGFNFHFTRTSHDHEPGEGVRHPRHNHTFQQIRYVEKGRSDVTPGQYIEEGEIGYFPRGAYYGPQERERGTAGLGVQFGFNGEHQRGPYWESRRAEALQRLNERGRIEEGRYIWTDPETGEVKTRDAVDALYDERYQMLKGKPLVIPPAGYEAPIIMHPKAFSYFQAGPGVEVKHLGQFYDQPGPNGDVRISMVRLDGGVYPLEADRPFIAFTVQPGLEVEGRVYPDRTAVYSPRGEDGLISGKGGLEVIIYRFPRLD